MSEEPPIMKSTDDARQGETSGRMRWVLGVSVAAVIMGMIVAYFLG